MPTKHLEDKSGIGEKNRRKKSAVEVIVKLKRRHKLLSGETTSSADSNGGSNSNRAEVKQGRTDRISSLRDKVCKKGN